MKPSTLPLEGLFYRLREHGLSLGIDEYVAALRSLQAGFGLFDQYSLRQLCMSLWIKTEDEALLFNRLFDQMLERSSMLDPADTSKPGIESDAEKERSDDPHFQDHPTENSSSKEMPLETNEPLEIVQAIRHRQINLDIGRPKYSLLTEYFPVTRRQMKQSWRHLRHLVREGPPTELDINSTVEKISRDGYFSEPVLVPRRSNRAEIVLLIDQDGSMVPFHALSRQLADTARRGGILQQTRVYYFHDYPAEYLYADPTRLTAQQTIDVLMSIDIYTAVLIVSDAGAARGNFDRERIKQTSKFIQILKQQVRRFAWMNPLPIARWQNTTANEIARFVPMFDMSRHGLDGAINLLRGRYVYGEKLYSRMI